MRGLQPPIHLLLLTASFAAGISSNRLEQLPASWRRQNQQPFLDAHPLPSIPGSTNTLQPTRNLQVAHTPRVPKGGKVCQQVLLEHDFGNSYYDPAIAKYEPPIACGAIGEWAAIVLNLTVESNGTQFDRLGSISLDHVEIWRTSTAEPTAKGIIWTAVKEVTRFAPLFARNATLMFDENNLLTETYTGVFKTILTATFYEATSTFPTPPKADLILPLSTKSKKQSQMLIYPGDTSTLVMIPNNTAEAYVEIIASGNADEEFWYTNVLDEFVEKFDENGIIAKGPFREVQLLIDSKLAGVVYPFPVLYTGGANPLLWRPLASLRAFDVPSFYIDITPFLPLLTDDAPHNYSLIVHGQGKDNSVNANWLLTGNIQLKLDRTLPPEATTGKMITYIASPSAYTSSKGSSSNNNTELNTSVRARRRLHIASLVTTAGGGTKFVTSTQVMSFSNKQHFELKGLYESVEQSIEVATASTHNGVPKLTDTFSFPLSITTNYSLYPHSFSASIGPYSYDRLLLPPPTAGGEIRSTKSSQVGRASLIRNEDGKGYVGDSETSVEYEFWEGSGDTFEEVTKAVNGTIVSDEKSGTLADDEDEYWTSEILSAATTISETKIDGVAVRPVAGGLRPKSNSGKRLEV